ncbi:MAG: class I SAM-dependent methyltransferase, partial [Deltaproteobacteria bacterium]|nr:class I SAM-dependent methyltransferase [Deltaproteobacteria bacterium]
MATENNYRVLSKIYRRVAEQRQHFEKQHQVLRFLLSMHNLSVSAKILDAACGSGDAAIMLHSDGYRNIHALDGSQYMLSL